MAFVILQNILRWHSNKMPAGGTNLWVAGGSVMLEGGPISFNKTKVGPGLAGFLPTANILYRELLHAEQ